MKPLSWLRVGSLVVGLLWVQVVLGAQAQDSKNGFQVLCDVLRSAEKVLNTTGTESEPLKEALFGRKNGLLYVDGDQVSATGTCYSQRLRGLLCTYYSGGTRKSGCFAESLAGALLCTCTPGPSGRNICNLETLPPGDTWTNGLLENKKDLFQKVWGQVQQKCIKNDGSILSHSAALTVLNDTLDKVRGNLKVGGKQGSPRFFYLGEVNCAGPYGSKSCVTYLGQNKEHVPIPWLSKMQTAIESLKQREHATAATPTLQSPSEKHQTPTEPEAPKNRDSLNSTNPIITTEEEHTEDIFSPGTPSPTEHPGSPKSRSKRSTTESPTTTSTTHDDTSTTDEPETLDPTAAPFPLADGANILAPLGLFTAAASFF